MLPGLHGQGNGVANGLVESAVRPVPIHRGLAAVGHEVLNVTHLMVNGLEVFHFHFRTHLYSTIFNIKQEKTKVIN